MSSRNFGSILLRVGEENEENGMCGMCGMSLSTGLLGGGD